MPDNQRLVVTEVGATLRSYQVAGREFLWGFKETELPTDANGQLLLPCVAVAGEARVGAMFTWAPMFLIGVSDYSRAMVADEDLHGTKIVRKGSMCFIPLTFDPRDEYPKAREA